MKELLKLILAHALPPSADLAVTQRENEGGVTLEIKVPSEFRGKIIGRAGTNINALRDVLNILAYEQNKRVYIKVLD